MLVQQVKIVKDKDVNVFKIIWLEKFPKLKEGARITLKGEDKTIWWRIIKVYDAELESSLLHRNWEVGGLN